jgi:hypothetical protein
VQQFGPRLQETLAGLGPEPGYARAVLTHRLGRCFLLGNRFDLALGFFEQALAVAAQLPPSDPVNGLQVLVRLELAGGLHAGSMLPEARKAYEAALVTAEELKDLRAVALEEGGPSDRARAGGAAAVPPPGDRTSETLALQHLRTRLQVTQRWNKAERHTSGRAHLRRRRMGPAPRVTDPACCDVAAAGAPVACRTLGNGRSRRGR